MIAGEIDAEHLPGVEFITGLGEEAEDLCCLHTPDDPAQGREYPFCGTAVPVVFPGETLGGVGMADIGEETSQAGGFPRENSKDLSLPSKCRSMDQGFPVVEGEVVDEEFGCGGVYCLHH